MVKNSGQLVNLIFDEIMTYQTLLEALRELPKESLSMSVKIVKDREVYGIDDIGLVGEIHDPSLQEKLLNQNNLCEEYPIIIL